MRQLLYYKIRQVVLLQNDPAIETCDIYYKIHRYNEICSPKYQNVLYLSQCIMYVVAFKLEHCQEFYLCTKVNSIAKT